MAKKSMSKGNPFGSKKSMSKGGKACK